MDTIANLIVNDFTHVHKTTPDTHDWVCFVLAGGGIMDVEVHPESTDTYRVIVSGLPSRAMEQLAGWMRANLSDVLCLRSTWLDRGLRREYLIRVLW